MTAVAQRTSLITEPGTYDIDEHTYHADPVAGGSLSSSGARTLVTRSPARFAHEREHGRPDTAAFDLGHAAHARVLGVGDPLMEVPADDWRSKSAREDADAIRAAGGIPLLSKQLRQVEAMVAAVRAHPVAGPLFARAGRAEQTLVARDPESGVMCRARPDWLPHVADGARRLVVDLKTTTSADPRAFAKSMADFGYHQQDPFYCDVLHWLGLTGDIEPGFVLVAVEKDPPHLVSVGRPTARAREWGRVLNRKARDLFRHGLETGEWPGYEPRVHDLDLPGWQVAAYERDHDAGRFDTASDLEEFTDDH